EGDLADASVLGQSSQSEQILVGEVGRGEDGDLVGRVVAQRGDHEPERVVAREVLTALPREADAALVVHRAEAIAADVADPPRVDRVVEARLQPRHAPAARVVRALAVDVDVDVAAARAPGTDGLRRVEIPDAHLEAEVPVGQRAHGTDVHDVARVVVLEILTREEADLRAVAAAEDAELAGAGDLVAEAHAARAENAALGVQHHVRPERHRLWLMDLLVGHPRIIEPVLHVVDLEPALAGLVAHGTVERMVDEMEFHHRPPRLLHAVGFGGARHAVRGYRAAGEGRPRRFVDVHHTEATLPGDREPRVVTIVRDVDAQPARGLDEIRADLDLDLLAVDGDLRHGSRTA